MNKKKWHHYYRSYFSHFKARYFLIIMVISLSVSVYALRSNNETMITLRNQLYSADKMNGDVQGALDRLQSYVIAHMNTNLSSGADPVYPPIQLKYTYQRLVSAESKQVASTNINLYTDAENYCQTVIPIGTIGFSGKIRVPCIEQYVLSHGTKINPIPVSLYEFDFVSPVWSPDLAGISLLISLLAFLLAIFDYLITKILYRSVK